MTWANVAKQKFEQAMEQFKGKQFPCFYCGNVGEYDKDLDIAFVNIGQFVFDKDGLYTASIDTTFMCKDYKVCKQRKENKS